MARVAVYSKFGVTRPLHLCVNRREFITLPVLQAPGVVPHIYSVAPDQCPCFPRVRENFFLATLVKKELRKFNFNPHWKRGFDLFWWLGRLSGYQLHFFLLPHLFSGSAGALRLPVLSIRTAAAPTLWLIHQTRRRGPQRRCLCSVLSSTFAWLKHTSGMPPQHQRLLINDNMITSEWLLYII